MIADFGIAIPLAVVCVLISAFCSGTEVALFSLRRVDREQLSRSELWVDKRILKVLERPRRLIATVLIGNQTFNSLLAVIALAVVIRMESGLAWWAIGGLALAIALPLIVLIAEVTSKTLAAKAPLAWARVCIAPLSLFAVLITPIRLVLQTVTEVVLRPLGERVRTRPARDLSEEEFRSLLDAGSAQGQVDARERRLIHRVFEFNDKNVGQVMTPRERIFALSYDLSMQRLVKEVAARGFSRVPIYQKSLDNIRGILNAKDLVRSAAGQPLGRPLAELLHEPLFVPRATPVKRLFLTFKQKKVHMAIVVSEYGKVLGLVTMDDLLAQIFGVLRDERAELQSQPPGPRNRVRTPVAGAPAGSGDPTGPVPREAARDDSGPIPNDVVPKDLETGPVPRTDLDTGPVIRPTPPSLEAGGVVSKRADTDLSGSIQRPDSQPGDGGGVLDPPPPSASGIRPIYSVDEVTPPAVDIEDLQRTHQERKR